MTKWRSSSYNTYVSTLPCLRADKNLYSVLSSTSSATCACPEIDSWLEHLQACASVGELYSSGKSSILSACVGRRRHDLTHNMSDVSGKEKALQQTYRTFIAGCHILHYHNVVDAYGHLSFRHPFNPNIFVMSRYIAPGNVSSSSDLIEYHVESAEPVDPKSAKGYSERCIHSECYKRFPSVNSVIHSHSEAVVPYGISGVPLRACYHMAGFLGNRTPIFEIADVYRPEDIQDSLVRNTHLGGALASHFSESDSADEPDHAVVLMRGHGFTVVGGGIEEAVLRAIYTQKNALIQTTALTTLSAHSGGSAQEIRYLSDKEAEAATDMTRWSASRPWKLWVREVEAANLYVNLG